MNEKVHIKVIIGLGNPGRTHEYQRHNIGFRVLDALVDQYNGSWAERRDAQMAEIVIHGSKVLLIKPQTYMNSSGQVIPPLSKKGVGAQHILVVHDELEKPFGSITIKQGGSAKGHNGLRSIMQYCGPDFSRVRFGIGRPERKEDVGDYVLSDFSEPIDLVDAAIARAVTTIENLFAERTV